AVSDLSVPVGNREFVTSQFNDIFTTEPLSADETRVRTIVSTLVTNQFVAFGGPCDRYDRACPGFVPGLFGFDTHGVRANASMIATPNVLRRGYIMRTCEEILAIDAAVTNALAAASLTASSNRDTSNIGLLADVFMPGRPPSAQASAALLSVAEAGAANGFSALDQWRFVMLSLCEASFFEML
ncbi:MAG TPA: hypothetical protein VFV50_18005, partial [Bdellovibrionales bacterium]|nr:hypothetical protein [Bdellovibrionales bacterium]